MFNSCWSLIDPIKFASSKLLWARCACKTWFIIQSIYPTEYFCCLVRVRFTPPTTSPPPPVQVAKITKQTTNQNVAVATKSFSGSQISLKASAVESSPKLGQTVPTSSSPHVTSTPKYTFQVCEHLSLFKVDIFQGNNIAWTMSVKRNNDTHFSSGGMSTKKLRESVAYL